MQVEKRHTTRVTTRRSSTSGRGRWRFPQIPELGSPAHLILPRIPLESGYTFPRILARDSTPHKRVGPYTRGRLLPLVNRLGKFRLSTYPVWTLPVENVVAENNPFTQAFHTISTRHEPMPSQRGIRAAFAATY